MPKSLDAAQLKVDKLVQKHGSYKLEQMDINEDEGENYSEEEYDD